jgi:hypothetical protein
VLGQVSLGYSARNIFAPKYLVTLGSFPAAATSQNEDYLPVFQEKLNMFPICLDTLHNPLKFSGSHSVVFV